MIALLQGILLGFGYVMPIGAQNLYVIQSSINNNIGKSLRTALVVILMDVSLAIVCFFSAGQIFSTHIFLARLVQFFGGIYLFWISYYLLRSKVKQPSVEKIKSSSTREIIRSAFILTWLNPQAVVDGSVLLGSIKSSLQGSESLLFITGVGMASCIWFLSITFLLSFFRTKINSKFLLWINYSCAAVLIWFGFILMAGSFKL